MRPAHVIVTALLMSAAPQGLMAQTNSALEQLKAIHAAPVYSEALKASGIMADDIEWWVMGDAEVFPWAGTWRGIDGVKAFFAKLNAEMRYDRFKLEDYVADGDDVVAIISAGGTARKTGRRFDSGVIRIYTLKDGLIVRVRNYYDTQAYAQAMGVAEPRRRGNEIDPAP